VSLRPERCVPSFAPFILRDIPTSFPTLLAVLTTHLGLGDDVDVLQALLLRQSNSDWHRSLLTDWPETNVLVVCFLLCVGRVAEGNWWCCCAGRVGWVRCEAEGRVVAGYRLLVQVVSSVSLDLETRKQGTRAGQQTNHVSMGRSNRWCTGSFVLAGSRWLFSGCGINIRASEKFQPFLRMPDLEKQKTV
jgi:hypothetical protein